MAKTNLKVVSGAKPVPVENDGKLIISIGKSRYETKWKNTTMLWSKLLERIGHSLETGETHAEYMRMSKDRQDRIKDIGGFVGGHLKEGHRRNGYVEARQILTLDLDFPPEGFWGKLVEMADNFDLDCAFAVYSTHKHTDKNPRYRLIIPLDRTVSPDEYEAIARKVAEKVGIDYFDDTTFQPTRLMYWPSHSSDVDPFFDYHDEVFLSADGILGEYPDWTDTSYWPMSSRVDEIRQREAKRAGNPLEKPGIIGAFNQTYTISAAIGAFLSDVYTPTAQEDRYTYAAGSTAAGLVIYEGDLFAYSNHSTDPAGGKLCNAFDLVRIHCFGDMDKDVEPNTPVNKLPSYQEMVRAAQADDDVKRHLLEQAEAKAKEDFAPLEDGEDWRTRLAVKKNGAIENTLSNIRLILMYDERLQSLRLNTSTDMYEADPDEVPWHKDNKYWTNIDADCLYTWIAVNYGVQFPSEQFYRAIADVAMQRQFHPIKDFLAGLPEWDGVPRVDTLLIDYFAAEDNIYTREAARKTLTAAVARILSPGVKFDYMLVLNGDQGIGKSTFFNKLSGEWFSDNLNMADMRDKSGAEKLRGYWILEIGEMAGIRKVEVESVKAFLSRREDIYRPAFGRTTERHPRQCIIVGSTNAKSGFLRDVTGNRRFWPVNVSAGNKSPWDITDDEIRQIWAEALHIYKSGEKLTLSDEAEEIARGQQREAMEEDPRQPLVEDYLNKLLPENWEERTLEERLDFLDGGEDGFFPKEVGTVRRETVSNMEIWVECFRNRQSVMEKKDSYAITAIMEKINGWERTEQRVRIPLYGQQRIFKRISEDYDF